MKLTIGQLRQLIKETLKSNRLNEIKKSNLVPITLDEVEKIFPDAYEIFLSGEWEENYSPYEAITSRTQLEAYNKWNDVQYYEFDGKLYMSNSTVNILVWNDKISDWDNVY